MKKGLYAIICIMSLHAVGQSDSTATKGDIVTGEVIIEKDKAITLPKADKIYQPAMLKSFSSDPLNIRYSVVEPAFEWPDYKSDVPFEPAKQRTTSGLFPNYIKLGYGNYRSPIAEIGIYQVYNDLDIKSRLFYERFGSGPVNDENSANSTSAIDLSVKYKTKHVSIEPFIDLAANKYRFYGNTNRVNSGFVETVNKASWTSMTVGTKLTGNTKFLSYSIVPAISNDRQKLSNGAKLNGEAVMKVDATMKYKMDTSMDATLNASVYTGSYDGGLTYNRTLIRISPGFRLIKDQFSINVGFNVLSSTTEGVGQSGFYPNIYGEWHIVNDWRIYGEINGDIQWNSLNGLLREVAFMDDSLTITNTEKEFAFGGGIKGSPFNNLQVKTGINLSSLRGLPLFVPSSTDSSRFMLTYDDRAITRLTFNTDLTYSPSNVLTFGASLQLNSYSTGSIDRPWHLPTFIFSGYAGYNINEKLIFSVTLMTIGSIKAPANVSFGILSLDSFVDTGIGLKYLITNRASAFVDVNNLFNNEYERYIGYPVRGRTFKIGGKYRF